MLLKAEMHRIMGLCAVVTFMVIGLVAFWQVRVAHRQYVQARGVAMGQALALAITQTLDGPNPEEDIQTLLQTQYYESHPGQLDLRSAVVYNTKGKPVSPPIGDIAHDPKDHHVDQAFRSRTPGDVQVAPGDRFGRFGKDGEELVEFAVPLIDRKGERRGVLVFSLARSRARTSFWRTILFILLGAALGIALLWYALYKMLGRLILKPILQLSEGIKKVRGGDLTARVGIYRRDEIGTLVESFNDLIAVLVERDSLQARLEEANRLAEAHRKLNEAHRQLKEAQEQLIMNEKHASLGRLVHGLNHELNNPLSAAHTSIPPLRAAMANLRAALAPPPQVPEPVEEPKPAPVEEPELDPPAPEPEETDQELVEKVEAKDTASDLDGIDVTTKDTQRMPSINDETLEDLEDAAHAIDILSRSLSRAINIVHDLDHFSRLTTADLEKIELRAIVDEALAACEKELGPDGRISVSVDIPLVEGEPLRLKAFPHLLAQVLVNLITNSAQAIDGSGRIRIWARLFGDGQVKIELDDNGPGIPKENLHKVFEPFFTTKEPGQGTGLGLSICLGVVEKHGGTIEARRRWRGAHFVIVLPLEPTLDETLPSPTSILAGSSVIGPSSN